MPHAWDEVDAGAAAPQAPVPKGQEGQEGH